MKFSTTLLSIITILSLVFSPLETRAEGFSLIRDAEIETCIRQMAEPIFKAAGLPPQNVRIHIIADQNINAFVAEGMNIFVNTGIITYSTDPMVLMGVLAHETGHIAGGHLIRSAEEMKGLMTGSILGMLLGMATAVAGHSGSGGVAVMSGTQQMAERSYLQYSRVKEASADNAGLKFLAALHLSPEGMLKLLQYLNSQENLFFDKMNPYVMTHPLSKERIENIQSALSNSPYADNPPPENLRKCFPRSVAKLKAFMQEPSETFRDYPESDKSLPARYARAIAYYKIPELDKAISLLDQLIKENPDDAYFYELKGQILFENGRVKESVAPYAKAEKLAPGAVLIKLGLGTSEVAVNTPDLNHAAITQLKQAAAIEPDNAMVWHQLGTAYGQVNQIPQSMLALAEEAMLDGKISDAQRFAELAHKGLSPGSPDYIKASDIISSAKLLKKDKKDRPDKADSGN